MVTPVLGLISVAKDASAITLRDVTGTYDSVTNPGGYGTPNAPVPVTIGFTFKNWTDALPYVNIVSGLGTSSYSGIASAIQSGYSFTQALFGLPGTFKGGVQQIKYYPFEDIDSIISLTNGSNVVMVTSGTLPSAFNAAYKAMVVFSGDGAQALTNVALMNTVGSSDTFTIDQPWTGATGGGYKMLIAPEADLKVLVSQLADNCLCSKIGRLSMKQNCDTETINTLTTLTMWMYAAQIKFDAKDYEGANELITDVQARCILCNSPACNTC